MTMTFAMPADVASQCGEPSGKTIDGSENLGWPNRNESGSEDVSATLELLIVGYPHLLYHKPHISVILHLLRTVQVRTFHMFRVSR